NASRCPCVTVVCGKENSATPAPRKEVQLIAIRNNSHRPNEWHRYARIGGNPRYAVVGRQKDSVAHGSRKYADTSLSVRPGGHGINKLVDQSNVVPVSATVRGAKNPASSSTDKEVFLVNGKGTDVPRRHSSAGPCPVRTVVGCPVHAAAPGPGKELRTASFEREDIPVRQTRTGLRPGSPIVSR